MAAKNYEIYNNKVVITLNDRVCFTSEDLVNSDLFKRMLTHCVEALQRKNSVFINIFEDPANIKENHIDTLIKTLKFLTNSKNI